MEIEETANLIIDVPEKLSSVRRATERGVTLMAAIVWLVALRPLLAIGLWYMGWKLAYTHMVRLQGLHNLGYFALLGATALTLASSLFLWNRYNAARFRGETRRGARGATGADEMAAFFGIAVAELGRLQGAREIVVYRPQRTQILLACGDGTDITGEHEPLGRPTAAWSPLRRPPPQPARQAPGAQRTAPAPQPLGCRGEPAGEPSGERFE